MWFGRRGAGVKRAIRSAGDGGKRAVLREEREVNRKPIAQGRPGCSACTCMLVCSSCLCANGTRDRGCGTHPVFPAPSDFKEGQEKFKPRAPSVARRKKLCPPRHCERSEAIHASTCGAMDCFAEPVSRSPLTAGTIFPAWRRTIGRHNAPIWKANSCTTVRLLFCVTSFIEIANDLISTYEQPTK